MRRKWTALSLIHHSEILSLKFEKLSLTIDHVEKHAEKEIIFDVNIMFFLFISDAIYKSKIYLSYAQNSCRKHS